MDKNIIAETNKNAKVVQYDDHQQLRQQLTGNKADLIVCDAARPINSEQLVDEMVGIIRDSVQHNASVLIKTFGNPIQVWRLATQFKTVYTYETNVGTETYYLLLEYKEREVTTLEELYETYGKQITHHVLPFKKNKVIQFIRAYTKKIASDVTDKCVNRITNVSDTKFTIRAITAATAV